MVLVYQRDLYPLQTGHKQVVVPTKIERNLVHINIWMLIALALYISEKRVVSSLKPPSLLLVKEVSKLNRQLYIYILYITCIIYIN